MRTCITVIEKTAGESDWEVAFPPGNDPQVHRDFVKSLPTGDQRAIVFESSGPGKRRRVTWSPSPARGRPKKSSVGT